MSSTFYFNELTTSDGFFIYSFIYFWYLISIWLLTITIDRCPSVGTTLYRWSTLTVFSLLFLFHGKMYTLFLANHYAGADNCCAFTAISCQWTKCDQYKGSEFLKKIKHPVFNWRTLKITTQMRQRENGENQNV